MKRRRLTRASVWRVDSLRAVTNEPAAEPEPTTAAKTDDTMDAGAAWTLWLTSRLLMQSGLRATDQDDRGKSAHHAASAEWVGCITEEDGKLTLASRQKFNKLRLQA